MRSQMLEAISTTRYRHNGLAIDPAQSRLIAEKWASEPFTLPSWDSPITMEANLNLAANFFFLGNLINFGFDHSDTLGPVGSNAFWLALRCHPELLDPPSLINLTVSDFTRIFGQLPLSEERVNLWQEAARTLRLRYNCQVTELYEANHWNAPEIIQAMANDFSGFGDTVSGIPFLRKARLTLFMTHARFRDSMLFSNLDQLCVCADLQVFNGLVQLGVVELDPNILQVLATAPINDSYLEAAIRALIIQGAETLLADLNSLRTDKVSTVQLDYRLRQMGTMGRAPLNLAKSRDY